MVMKFPKQSKVKKQVLFCSLLTVSNDITSHKLQHIHKTQQRPNVIHYYFILEISSFSLFK